MIVEFAVRAEERNDIQALAIVKAQLPRYGLRIDHSRPASARRNGGLWQYEVPVEEFIAA